jgi:mannobiose 2-epimerase
VDGLRWRAVTRSAALPDGGSLGDWAEAARADLAERVLPHWYDTAVDHERGGYLLGRHAWRAAPPVGKQLITQTRMVWGFSLAARLGLGGRDYLGAATQGYDFVARRFADPEHGGYWWMTLLDGTPSVRRKVLNGHTFALFAFVEHHRATGDQRPLEDAFGLLPLIEHRFRDHRAGGWRSSTGEDWDPAVPADPLVPGAPAHLAGDAHLHLVEALTQLVAVAGKHPSAGDARAALRDAVDVSRRSFFPPDPAAAVVERDAAGRPVGAPASLGHDVEFAWLLERARSALGLPPDLGTLDRYVRHALAHGWDDRHGGLVDEGTAAVRRRRMEWWPQAELLAALVVLVAGTGDEELAGVLRALLRFVWGRQRDPRDGMWLTAVTPSGRPLDGTTAGEWKGAYHDVRALVELVAAFGGGWGDQRRWGPAAPGAVPDPSDFSFTTG